MRTLLFCATLSALVACENKQPPAPPPADAEIALEEIADAGDAGDMAAQYIDVPFADLVRRGQWEPAARAVAALDKDMQERPEMRFVRAKIQLELGKAEDALTLLDGLDTALPGLIDRITLLRAESAWRAGRAEEAGGLFARLGPRYAVRAAEAYARAGNAEGVRKATAIEVGEGNKRAREAKLRGLRLRFEDEANAQGDARWLATFGAAEEGGEEGMRYLREKKITLNEHELEARGKALAEAGKVNEVREVASAVEQGGKPAHHTLACFMRASALYHSRASYKEAHQAFSLCEKVARDVDEKAESAFLASRALLRADLDDDAIVSFERMLERYPKSSKANEARALIARTHLLHARYDKAHELYESWAPQMKGNDEFAHYRPLAALLAGRAGARRATEKARSLFEERTSHKDATEARFATLFSAVAAEQGGDATIAKSRLRNLYEKSPWSLAGQFAKQRLDKLGEAPAPMQYEADIAASPPLEVALPEGSAVLHAQGLDDDAAAFLEPRESMVAAAAHGRETEALCSVYATLGRAQRTYRMSGRLPRQYLDHKPIGGARWVWECMYPTPYSWAMAEAVKRYPVPEGLAYAVMRTESGYDPEARSPVGAVGLMQLMPQTAERLEKGARFAEPSKNIELGVLHLHEDHAAEDNWPLAVMGYNGSPEAVARWRKRLPELPLDLFIALTPLTETRGYVVKVLEAWARYQVLADPSREPALDLELPTARR